MKDADSLFVAMDKFIKLNENERCEMGQESRKRMEEMFDKKKIVSQTMEKIMQR